MIKTKVAVLGTGFYPANRKFLSKTIWKDIKNPLLAV